MRVYERIRNYDKLIQGDQKKEDTIKIQESSLNGLSWHQSADIIYHMLRILLLFGPDISNVTK